MVNILPIVTESGETVQVNQKALHRKEEQSWLKSVGIATDTKQALRQVTQDTRPETVPEKE